MVDTRIQWPDATVLINSTVKHGEEKFDQTWLCSKPYLRIIVHNNGTKFTGAVFQEMLSSVLGSQVEEEKEEEVE